MGWNRLGVGAVGGIEFLFFDRALALLASGAFFLVGLLARDVLEWDSWVWHVVCMHARDFVGIGECVHAF